MRLNVYLGNAQNHVGIVGTIQGNVMIAYLKATNSVLGRTKIRNRQSDEVNYYFQG